MRKVRTVKGACREGSCRDGFARSAAVRVADRVRPFLQTLSGSLSLRLNVHSLISVSVGVLVT